MTAQPTPTLQSLIAGRWIGQHAASALRSAVNGRELAATHAEAIDFAEAVEHARQVGGPALLALDFQARAERLKALAKFLGAHKELLYAVSAHTGATRADSAVDIEGGSGTLLAYAAIGSNELPSGNLLHEGPAFSLSKQGGFAGSHILVPRGGVAVHINAFNRPVWGLLEKFAPSFLAGMPCIAKPASATSYLTEALPAGFHDDPYRWYAALRSQSPVRWMPDGSLLLMRWADCEAVYRDAKLFSSDKREVIGNLLRIPPAERGSMRWTSAANPIGT